MGSAIPPEKILMHPKDGIETFGLDDKRVISSWALVEICK